MYRVYISGDDTEWIFPAKYSLQIGASVRDLNITITPKVNNDLGKFLERSTGLIKSESGQEEFISVTTKGRFSSRIKGVEEAIEKLNKIGNDFYINESYFLFDKSS